MSSRQRILQPPRVRDCRQTALRITAGCALACVLLGCGGETQLYELSGQVTFDGRPVEQGDQLLFRNALEVGVERGHDD